MSDDKAISRFEAGRQRLGLDVPQPLVLELAATKETAECEEYYLLKKGLGFD